METVNFYNGGMSELTMAYVGGFQYAIPENAITNKAVGLTNGDLYKHYAGKSGAIILNAGAVLILEDLSGKPATARRTVAHELLHMTFAKGDADVADLFELERTGVVKEQVTAEYWEDASSAAIEIFLMNNCSRKKP